MPSSLLSINSDHEFNMKNQWILPAVFLFLGLFFQACETTRLPDPYYFNVVLDESLEGASVQVDVIGVSRDERDLYANKSVTEYFEPGDSLRQSAVKESLIFGRHTSSLQSISASDPIWSRWIEERGAEYVVFLADVPGLKEDKPGNADSRRLILPLDKAKWDERPEIITIEVSSEDILSDPGPLEVY